MTFLVTIMLLAPIAGVVGTAGATNTSGQQADDPENYIELNDDVSVWKQAALPFRTATETDTTITELPGLSVQTTGEGDSPLNRESLSVYKTGDTVGFSYDHSNADTAQFSEAQVLIGHLDENVTEDDVDMDSFPTTGDELLTELAQNNLEDLNNNVSFELESVDDVTAEDFEYTPTDSGFYTFVMVEGQDNLDLDGDDVTIDESVSVIGIEQLVAHDKPSEVSVSAGEPGDDVTFDIETTLGDDVNHAVVLYNADDFDDSSMTFNVTDELTTDLSVEDVIIEHSVEEVNGVQNLEDDVEFLGESIENRTASGFTQFGDIITFLGNDADFETPDTEATGEDTIDASSTATVAGENATLVVETHGNWSEGDYRWIHVAMGSSSDQIQAATGLETIEKDDPPGGGGGGGGIVMPPGDDDDEPELPAPTAVISIDPDPATVGEEVTFSGADSTDDERNIISYDWTIDGDSLEGETITKTFKEPGTYDVELTVTNDFAQSDTETTKLTVKKGHKPDDDDDDGPATDDDGGVDDGDTDADDGEPADDGDDEDGDSIPGFGLTATLVALLSIALLALRKQE
ncbi:PKD domain-containing protein [Natronorubrum thiooxidans]|uniref:PKD domain-containing protein n=1 Tax=Natronorubrum thiooxidans TaxID=308853 RepID=UPI00135659D4|nr:PKD domain-containing protein [Natronorubrum thiooxidans]